MESILYTGMRSRFSGGYSDMNRYQKVYHVSILTKGPVFIGSGNMLHKKEYVFLDHKTQIGILDVARFYQYLKIKGLSGKFEHFLMKDVRMDLYSWMRKNDISANEVEPYLKYKIPVGDMELNRDRAKWEIAECMKDAYGMPYVPGSSLKGALRTILMADRIHEKDMYKKMQSQIERGLSYGGGNSILRREDSNMAVELLHTLDRNSKSMEDSVNDEMAGMIVSDSHTLRPQDLVLCQKVEVHVDGTEKRLNLFRECIKPGTWIEFILTIDTKLCSVSREDIERGLSLFSDIYRECFLDAYDTEEHIGNHMFYLGGGSGFVSKTLIYPVFGKDRGIDITQKIFEKTRVPWKHKHDRDKRLGASPHILKCTRIDGKRYQMGLCELHFQ